MKDSEENGEVTAPQTSSQRCGCREIAKSVSAEPIADRGAIQTFVRTRSRGHRSIAAVERPRRVEEGHVRPGTISRRPDHATAAFARPTLPPVFLAQIAGPKQSPGHLSLDARAATGWGGGS